jgi:hypothetical protein
MREVGERRGGWGGEKERAKEREKSVSSVLQNNDKEQENTQHTAMAAACTLSTPVAADARSASARSAGPRLAAAVALPAPVVVVSAARALRAHIAAPPRATGGGRDSPTTRPPLPREEDFDADAPPGFWDSDAAGYLSVGGGLAAVVGCVALLLSLARPVIETTVGAFPVRGGSGGEAAVEAVTSGLGQE